MSPEVDHPAIAHIGIGANLGDARATVQAAVAALGGLARSSVVACSSLYRSAPVDAGGPDFINAVLALGTFLSPEALLHELLALELRFGRERPYRNAPRTLDLDLLLHGTAVRSTATLTLPHPRLHLRAFVLLPLLELQPGIAAPGLGPLAAYRAACAGQLIQRLPDA